MDGEGLGGKERQKGKTYDIIDRKDTGSPPHLASPPIRIITIYDFDNVSFFKCELAWFGGLERMESPNASDDTPGESGSGRGS